MREIVLDTETTGLDPNAGHRVVEIGCVELINHVATERHFHCYLDPERDMPADAGAVTGLTTEFLRGKPVFASQVADFLDFIGDAPLVIHNAPFDLGFMNMELARLGFPALPPERAIDTLQLARRKFPGAPASLDALCKRFDIDTSDRAKHGALIDARLTALVYLELIGGRQASLILGAASADASGPALAPTRAARARTRALPQRLTETEARAHEAFIAELGADAVWRRDPV